jgi:hypothetical protein
VIMATVTRTFLVDDLNGSTEDVATIQFNLDGTSYKIDLSATNQERLRDKLAKISRRGHPRPTASRGSPPSNPPPGEGETDRA